MDIGHGSATQSIKKRNRYAEGGQRIQTLTAAIVIFIKRLSSVLCPQTHLCHPTGDMKRCPAALLISPTPFQKSCIGSFKFQNTSVTGKKQKQEERKRQERERKRTLEGGLQLPTVSCGLPVLCLCHQQDDRWSPVASDRTSSTTECSGKPTPSHFNCMSA